MSGSDLVGRRAAVTLNGAAYMKAESSPVLATLVTALGAASSDRPLDLMCVDDAQGGARVADFAAALRAADHDDGDDDGDPRARPEDAHYDDLAIAMGVAGALAKPLPHEMLLKLPMECTALPEADGGTRESTVLRLDGATETMLRNECSLDVAATSELCERLHAEYAQLCSLPVWGGQEQDIVWKAFLA